MPVSYNKLRKLLIDHGMSQAQLRRLANIAPNTMTKLRRNEPLNLAVLGRICQVLECDFGDIMQYIPEQTKEIFSAPSVPATEMDDAISGLESRLSILLQEINSGINVLTSAEDDGAQR